MCLLLCLDHVAKGTKVFFEEFLRIPTATICNKFNAIEIKKRNQLKKKLCPYSIFIWIICTILARVLWNTVIIIIIINMDS